MFANKLKYYRQLKNFSQVKLAEAVGVSSSTISMYENGNREPDFETLEAIADVLNVSMTMLIGEERPRKTLVPVLGYVRAGIPIEAVEEILDYEEISQQVASRGDYFALKVVGDSMEPKFSEGDVVIVRQQEDVENGEFAIVLVNGSDGVIKRFYKNESGVTLMSTNGKYEPMYFPASEVESLPVKVIGKVVELRAKF